MHASYVLQDGERPPAEVTGAEALLDALIANGVDTVFGYPGGAALPLYDALFHRPTLRHVLVRHEQAAVHAAEGYARSTGRLGVVLVTSGPGIANTISGLLDALSDSIPVLCISGQVATALIGTNSFQECDAIAMSKPVTKWNAQVREVGDIVALLNQAVRVAMTGRPGPVLIDVPKDLQAQLFLPQPLQSEAAQAVPALPVSKALRNAVRLLKQAHSPVLYGGGGLVNSGLDACTMFSELAHRLNLPTTLTLMGLGAFPASDKQFLGMLGMHGTVEANMAMYHTDLVFCVGARFDDRVTGRLTNFSPNAKKIHLDIDPGSIGKLVHADVALPGDCAEVLRELLALMSREVIRADRLSPWWQRIAAWREMDCLAFADDRERILPQRLMHDLQSRLRGRDAIVSTDVGQHQMWAAQYLHFEAPRRWLTSGGAGTMGYGLPAAIGAQIAHPDRTVICVSGDASVLMNIQELSTATQHNAPVKLILCNNGYMGMVRQWQQLNHGNRLSHSWNEALPDFVALARAFGWGARRVDRPEDLAGALDECLASEAPFFLDVHVAAQENCFPMIPSGRSHNELMLSEDRWLRDQV